jgi:hypothetical protein
MKETGFLDERVVTIPHTLETRFLYLTFIQTTGNTGIGRVHQALCRDQS